jgi:uncharacterized protein YjbI with pentapeptide repeats
VRLERAILTGANASEARAGPLPISGHVHWPANLTYARLGSACLANADLTQANLRSADLSQADLRYADLSGASLCQAVLRGTDLRGIKQEGTDFTGSVGLATAKGVAV